MDIMPGEALQGHVVVGGVESGVGVARRPTRGVHREIVAEPADAGARLA